MEKACGQILPLRSSAFPSSSYPSPQKYRILAFFYSKRASSPPGNEVETQKTENRPTYCDFGIWLPETPTSPNFKTHKGFVLHDRNYIACKVYTYPITYLSFINIEGPFWIHSALRSALRSTLRSALRSALRSTLRSVLGSALRSALRIIRRQ